MSYLEECRDVLFPKDVQEAVELLAKYRGQARVVAGGTDVLVDYGFRGGELSYLVSLSRLSNLEYISSSVEGSKIGSLTKLEAIGRSPIIRQGFTALAESVDVFGSPIIRNRASIGGNVCRASPSGETLTCLIVLDAKAKIVGASSDKTIPIEQFFTGPGQTILLPDELLVELDIPNPPANSASAYLSHRVRKAKDIAIVNTAVLVVADKAKDVVEDTRIALGAVAPVPIRAQKAEGILRGNRWSENSVSEAGRVAATEARPVTDLRGSAEHRTEMVKVYTCRALRKAWERIKSSKG